MVDELPFSAAWVNPTRIFNPRDVTTLEMSFNTSKRVPAPCPITSFQLSSSEILGPKFI